MQVKLKSVTVSSYDAKVMITLDATRQMWLADETGSVAALLQLLAERGYEQDSLSTELAGRGFVVSAADVHDAVVTLDEAGLLERAGSENDLPPEIRQRQESNLRFFDLYSNLDRTSADIHRSIADSHVLLLGAGGVGCNVLQALVGLGVGHVTIVDFDTVESKNLVRQFAYGEDTIGQRKVDAAKAWATRYSAQTTVDAVDRRIETADMVAELAANADAVVCAIDTPANSMGMVNEACMRLGIPFVLGALQRYTLLYFSVDPGRSPCLRCLELHQRDEARDPDHFSNHPVLLEAERVNRGTGPIVQLVAGFVALETLRYLTRIEPPVAAGVYQLIALSDGMRADRNAWTYHGECELCELARA